MAPQVFGALISVVGFLWFVFSLTLDKSGQQQAVLSLWGVVGFVGGLILWALGRIECAISPIQGEGKRSGVSPLIPVFVIAVVVALALLWVLGTSATVSTPEKAPPHEVLKQN